MSDDLPGEKILPRSSALGLELAPKFCSPDCRAYHSVWGFLRMFGNLKAVSVDHEFLLTALEQTIRSGARRVLISGSADHGILAYVLHAFDKVGAAPDVVVIDVCPTPLEICADYASAVGHKITTKCVNALNFEAEPFDLVVAHNFLNFFSTEDREVLVRRWFDILKPQGSVVSVSTIKPGAPLLSRRFGESESHELANRMLLARAQSRFADLISEEDLRSLTIDYAKRRVSWNVVSVTELSRLFEQAGFAVKLAVKDIDPNLQNSNPKSKQRVGAVCQKP